MSDPRSLQSLHYLKEISHHKIILASSSFSFPQDFKQIKLYIYDRGNYEEINAQLEQFYTDYEQGFHSRSVETKWKFLVDKLNQLTDTYVPSIEIKNKVSAPWFNNTIKKKTNKPEKRLFLSAKTKNHPLIGMHFWPRDTPFGYYSERYARLFWNNAPRHAKNQSQEILESDKPKSRLADSLLWSE